MIKDNEELAHLYREDQSDRTLFSKGEIDWESIIPRDQARLARVKELYIHEELHTGADYYHVAMILQHSDQSEDYLLAHELCIIAIIKGEERAKWLAAASEDSFLMSIERPQRFGTQYCREEKTRLFYLYEVDKNVTDAVRREFNVPSLEAARAQERLMNEK